LRKIGNSQIDSTVKFYGDGDVVIGDRSRIDQGVIICSGPKGVFIGDNVHISSNVLIAGTNGRVEFRDFSGVGAGSKFYTASEDPLSGLTNPTIPQQFRNCVAGDVIVMEHALIYADVIVCRGVTLGFGSGVGAKTIVKNDIPEGVLIAGNPNKVIGKRNVEELRILEHRYKEARNYTTAEHCQILMEYMGIP